MQTFGGLSRESTTAQGEKHAEPKRNSPYNTSADTADGETSAGCKTQHISQRTRYQRLAIQANGESGVGGKVECQSKSGGSACGGSTTYRLWTSQLR